MDMFSTIAAGLVVFITLIANAFTKIMLMFLGVMITFLIIPQTRVAAMLGVALIGAFAGGILIDVYSVQNHWVTFAALAVSFVAGMFMFPILSIFKKFNDMLMQDQEVVDLIYGLFKGVLKKMIKTIDKKEDIT